MLSKLVMRNLSMPPRRMMSAAAGAHGRVKVFSLKHLALSQNSLLNLCSQFSQGSLAKKYHIYE